MTRRLQGPRSVSGQKPSSPRGSLPPCGGGTGRGKAKNAVLAKDPLPHPPPQGGRERAEPGGSSPQIAGPSVDVVVESSLWEAHGGAEALVRRAVAAAAPAETADAELAVLLADDARVRAMNAQWRGKDTATNVLSFPATPVPGPGQRHLGDIVVACETVEREAGEQDTPFDHHLVHLVVHGFLHLLGYDHMTDDEAEEMEQRERDILARLGIADPYAARDAASDH
jgi:probable rRNA maturation factor